MKREEQLVGTNQRWSFTALRQFGDYYPIKNAMMMISPIKNDDDQLFCGHFSAESQIGEGCRIADRENKRKHFFILLSPPLTFWEIK